MAVFKGGKVRYNFAPTTDQTRPQVRLLALTCLATWAPNHFTNLHQNSTDRLTNTYYDTDTEQPVEHCTIRYPLFSLQWTHSTIYFSYYDASPELISPQPDYRTGTWFLTRDHRLRTSIYYFTVHSFTIRIPLRTGHVYYHICLSG